MPSLPIPSVLLRLPKPRRAGHHTKELGYTSQWRAFYLTEIHSAQKTHVMRGRSKYDTNEQTLLQGIWYKRIGHADYEAIQHLPSSAAGHGASEKQVR